MLRELLIFRHGRAEDHVSDDFSRELTEKGKRNAQRIGLWMAMNSVLPDRVVSSPATRARNTAIKSCKAAGIHTASIQYDNRLYQADIDALLDTIRDVPSESQRLLLVGHNPGLHSVIEYLCQERPVIERLPTATLARVSLRCEWTEIGYSSGNCVEVIRPKTLPRVFPFPDENGTEQRSRPAYYYQQSSVIPYRQTDGIPEIMIVSSSSGKHWVVPKGIHDPGMTAQESAATEALEEAGVTGDVSTQPLGTYTYEKWGAECTVAVYGMKVTRELPDHEWEEPHRVRQWVPAGTAQKLVHNQDLRRLIGHLYAQLTNAARTEGRSISPYTGLDK